MRLVQFWVPDTRDPKVRADIAREVRAINEAPDFGEGMNWVESVSIFDEELREGSDATG